MATNSKKAVKAVDAPQDAAVVVKRTRKSAMPTAQFQEKQAALKANQGKPAVKKVQPVDLSTPAAKKAPAKKATVTPIEQGKVVKGVPAALVEKPAKKVAAKKSVSRRKPAESSNATPEQNSSTQSATSFEPGHVKADVPENKAAAEAATAEFNAKVASGELPAGLEAVTVTFDPTDVCAKLVSAANQVPAGLLRFPEEDRERLIPFLTFFERFWAAIPAYFKMEMAFRAEDFSKLQKQPEFANLVRVGSYARFEFTCGSRAIVLRTLVGCATFFYAENEFMDMLKKMPGAVPSIIKEQAEKNKPTLTLMANIPFGFQALVRELEPSKRLNLATLHRIFGDPVCLLMKTPQINIARNVQELALLLSTKGSAV